LRDVNFSLEEYKKIKEQNPDALYPELSDNPLNTAPVPKEKLDAMKEELDKTDARRKNFSRRRTFQEGAYVDYINEGNRTFNKKAARSFDKYTAEIKQNLERGTAV
jgi:pre-mRNA-splicing factor SYF2